tara:strand:- start:264 stop:434 length:171 start_codon:yes stop_codon:yes gene_type:complete
MWKALVKLIESWSRCEHDWEDYGKTKTFDEYGSTYPVKVEQTFICKKCKESKTISL